MQNANLSSLQTKRSPQIAKQRPREAREWTLFVDMFSFVLQRTYELGTSK